MQSVDDENSKRLKIMESLSLMLKNLDFDIVAEGIETQIQYDLCKRLNIEYLQGFLFSKPVPASKIDLLLSNKSKQIS